MSVRELISEINKAGLDASSCIEKSELVALLTAHRAAKSGDVHAFMSMGAAEEVHKLINLLTYSHEP